MGVLLFLLSIKMSICLFTWNYNLSKFSLPPLNPLGILGSCLRGNDPFEAPQMGVTALPGLARGIVSTRGSIGRDR